MTNIEQSQTKADRKKYKLVDVFQPNPSISPHSHSVKDSYLSSSLKGSCFTFL